MKLEPLRLEMFCLPTFPVMVSQKRPKKEIQHISKNKAIDFLFQKLYYKTSIHIRKDGYYFYVSSFPESEQFAFHSDIPYSWEVGKTLSSVQLRKKLMNIFTLHEIFRMIKLAEKNRLSDHSISKQTLNINNTI